MKYSKLKHIREIGTSTLNDKNIIVINLVF